MTLLEVLLLVLAFDVVAALGQAAVLMLEGNQSKHLCMLVVRRLWWEVRVVAPSWLVVFRSQSSSLATTADRKKKVLQVERGRFCPLTNSSRI
jgi:hypothetical protein